MFHDYTITWWYISLLKLDLVILGIIIGAAWPNFWKKPALWWILWLVLIILTVYLAVIIWPQI